MTSVKKGLPKISVLMPAYNAEKYISEAIDSILNQTYSDFEFIILDDNSTDKTWTIINKYAKIDTRIIAIKNETHQKTTRTLNQGIVISRGKYIVRMDADDWSYPERLAYQVKYMEEHPDVGVCGSNIDVCDSALKILNPRKYATLDKEIRKFIFRFSPFAHPSIILRKSILEIVGGYDFTIDLSQDYDLYFRIGIYSKFGNINKTLLKLRTHKSSSSQSRGRQQELTAILIRLKANMIYGYKMSTIDLLYTFVQYISVFLIPADLKFRIFNNIRQFKFT